MYGWMVFDFSIFIQSQSERRRIFITTQAEPLSLSETHWNPKPDVYDVDDGDENDGDEEDDDDDDEEEEDVDPRRIDGVGKREEGTRKSKEGGADRAKDATEKMLKLSPQKEECVPSKPEEE